MENYVVCVIRYVVDANQGETASMKFVRCLRKCFRLRDSRNANSDNDKAMI